MKIYLDETVYEAALRRIRWLFDEFPTVVVGVSGGKDSTVVFHLALQVAREKGRLPLKTMFLDQEAEYQSAIDIIKEIMYHPDVEPYWLQVPIKLFNASTHGDDDWLMCWDPKKEADWMRPKDPVAIKEDIYGVSHFHEIFPAFMAHHFGKEKTCYVSGMRCEEAPKRKATLTVKSKYKGITWAKRLTKKAEQFTFYPIYDWSYTDVWKAIFSNGWPYCKMYDHLYALGEPLYRLRVSNLHHETAMNSLYTLQEIEKGTYEKLVKRLDGISTAAQVGKDDFRAKTLPWMFGSWDEYKEFLLEKLITEPEMKKKFTALFDRYDNMFSGMKHRDDMVKVMVNTIILNDHWGTLMKNFETSPEAWGFLCRKRGTRDIVKFTKY